MNAELIARSVSERMFSRQCGIVDKLLGHKSASSRIIELASAELTARWTMLQEKHDKYVVVNIYIRID